MKTRWQDLVFATVFGLILPVVISGMWEKSENIKTLPPQETAPTQHQSVTETIQLIQEDGTTETLELEAYLVSVILREMPAKFETEALKAQAVVARTYALKRKGGGKHSPADICTKSGCCQGYYSTEAYLADGGKQENIEKVERAVKETAGQVLVYQGQLIDATYFACSGGRTEAALAVWGADVPYLQSIESPGEENAKHYIDTVTMTKNDLIKALELPDGKTVSIDHIQYTQGGGIDTISLNGKAVKGTTLRKQLDLNSTAVILTIVGDTVTITTKGNGHRVGMSQYGADAMAKNGATYDEILRHYYQQVELVSTLTFREN